MLRTTKQSFFMIVLPVLVLIALAALPLVAQEVTETPESTEAPAPWTEVVVTGEIQFTGDEILVGGYIIAPSGAFQPSRYDEGDLVVIIGQLLPDGQTVQADSIELFAGEEEEIESTPEATVEATAEATEAAPESTEDAGCYRPDHPVASAIAAEFEVDYNVVITLHCQGFGFGEIARAYLLAEASDGTADAQALLNLRGAGEGWGHIMREADVHPSDLAPGRIIRGRGSSAEATEVPEVTETPEANTSRGNGNGGGQGNTNGRGNANGNAANAQQGNANGNGNGSGNGNGGAQPSGSNGGRGNGQGNGRGNG